MMHLARSSLRRALATIGCVALALAFTSPAGASGLFGQVRYAAIVVDAANGDVLYSKRADELRYPASITKIMTLYLTFEALSTGRIALKDRVVVSQHAASMMPSKTQLRPGEGLSVDEAIRVVAVHSANDIAVALSEKIGGTESRFASLMTLRAQELGMANTRFVNANGVPDPRQVTTARDIAILSRAIMRDYPQYYSYFGLRTAELHGQTFTNHNHLLREPGYDGFKTGFTNAAGFNLAASAVRDGRRLITVVLGGTSAAARDENVQTLMNAGFDVLRKRALGVKTTIAANISEPDDNGPIVRPATEQGDGGQSGLSVIVHDPVHGDQTADQLLSQEKKQDPAKTPPPPPGLHPRRLASEPGGDCAARRHGHAKGRKGACSAHIVRLASVNCGKSHGRAHGRCGRRASMALAMAAAVGKGRLHHHRHRRMDA